MQGNTKVHNLRCRSSWKLLSHLKKPGTQTRVSHSLLLYYQCRSITLRSGGFFERSLFSKPQSMNLISYCRGLVSLTSGFWTVNCLLSIRSRRTQTVVLAEKSAAWVFARPLLCPSARVHQVAHGHLRHPEEAFSGGGGWCCELVHRSHTLGGALAAHATSSSTGNEALLALVVFWLSFWASISGPLKWMLTFYIYTMEDHYVYSVISHIW